MLAFHLATFISNDRGKRAMPTRRNPILLMSCNERPMRRRVATLILVILGWTWGPLVPWGARPLRADEELERHLEDLRRQVEDPRIDIGRREQLALEMAATLDRAGQAAPSIEARRRRWTEAIRLLERFGTRNPGHPRAHEFEFQAAVELSAGARRWQRPVDLDP